MLCWDKYKYMDLKKNKRILLERTLLLKEQNESVGFDRRKVCHLSLTCENSGISLLNKRSPAFCLDFAEPIDRDLHHKTSDPRSEVCISRDNHHTLMLLSELPL